VRWRRRAPAYLEEQFRFGFAHAVSEDEAKELYETFADSGWREVADSALAFVQRAGLLLDRIWSIARTPGLQRRPSGLRSKAWRTASRSASARRERLTAFTTAASDAATMLARMPTPQTRSLSTSAST
jgi:plasmid stabilization system protein ParE